MKSDPLTTFRRTPATLNRSDIEMFAQTLRLRVARGKEFHCLIAGDAELRSLNRAYRSKDYATDVLSFPGGEKYLGDIAISLGRARTQARQYGHTIETELGILMLHGLLHLRGMDHESDSGEMARAELRWRRKLELPSGLIERAA